MLLVTSSLETGLVKLVSALFQKEGPIKFFSALVQFVKKCPNKRPRNFDELDSCVQRGGDQERGPPSLGSSFLFRQKHMHKLDSNLSYVTSESIIN